MCYIPASHLQSSAPFVEYFFSFFNNCARVGNAYPRLLTLTHSPGRLLTYLILSQDPLVRKKIYMNPYQKPGWSSFQERL